MSQSSNKPIPPAVKYLFFCLVILSTGAFFSYMIRLQLGDDANTSEQTYNQFFTLHGVIMVFLFILPAIPSIIKTLCSKFKDKS